MTFINHSPEYLRQKLYLREKTFNNFEGITENRLIELSQKVEQQREISNERAKNSRPKDKLSVYMEILEYLTSPVIHTIIPSFDERIIFMIMATDPELLAFKEFLKTSITSNKEINAAENEKEKLRLSIKRHDELMELQCKIRKKIGFYDHKLIKYEQIYFAKFLKRQEFITEVQQDYVTGLLETVNFIKSFDKITDERYEELKEKAMTWIALTNAEKDLKTAAYSVTSQLEAIGLKNLAEQYVFLILIADSNLDILRIYEEESRIPNVEARIKEEFGYYNINLIKIERLYHDRFCPEQKLSPWTHM